MTLKPYSSQVYPLSTWQPFASAYTILNFQTKTSNKVVIPAGAEQGKTSEFQKQCCVERERLFFFKKIFYLFIFRERRREGEREGEKHQCVVALACPSLGIWPATQACALTGYQTGDPLVCRPVLNPLSYTSQG